MMAASTITLHLMCLLLWGEVAFVQLSVEEQQKSFVMADIGDNVTLHCFDQENNVMNNYISWYKQCLGDKPELLHSELKPSGTTILSKNLTSKPRFTVVIEERTSHLNISDVQLSDSAMYYCGEQSLTELHFKEGILLHVKGSSFSIQAIVQEPEKSVQPGDSVTLNCTVHTEPCAGEHSVYWFRQSENSQPVFFYTHDQRCEIANTTQGSFYNFSMKNFKPRDAGTYYCAVASCGEILYGNGTRLHVKCTIDKTMVHCLVVALVISIILVIVLSSIIYKLKRETNLHSRGHSPVSPANTVDQNEDNLHYAALNLKKKRRPRVRPQRNDMEDTVYAGVRL